MPTTFGPHGVTSDELVGVVRDRGDELAPSETATHVRPMSEITVTLPDGSTKSVADGATVRDVAAAISPRLASAAFAGAVDGTLVDLSHQLHRDAAVRVITDKSPEGLHVYRHSTAHLLAAAVTALFPGAQCGIGPATEDGFFYDFVVDRPFVPDDLGPSRRR